MSGLMVVSGSRRGDFTIFSKPMVLRLDYQALSQMSHKAFQDFIADLGHTSGSLSFHEIQMITNARKQHALFNRQVLIDLSIPSPNVLREAPYLALNKMTLDSLVFKFYQNESLVWDYRIDGCYARANYIGRWFRAIGINSECVSKIFIISDDNSLNHTLLKEERVSQEYHVAASIRLKDGTEWVVDPLIDHTRALSIREWLLRQDVDAQFCQDCARCFEDGTIKTSSYPSDDWPPKKDSNQKFMCKKMSLFTEWVGGSSGFTPSTREWDQIDSDVLVKYQSEIELEWIQKNFPSMHLRKIAPFCLIPPQPSSPPPLPPLLPPIPPYPPSLAPWVRLRLPLLPSSLPPPLPPSGTQQYL